MRIVQRANVNEVSCPPGPLTPVVVVPVPHLEPGWKLNVAAGGEFRPKVGTTAMMLTVNVTDKDGKYLTTPGYGNMAFWWITPLKAGASQPVFEEWSYDPRFNPPLGETPDADLGSGDGKFLGLNVYCEGGPCGLFSGWLRITAPTQNGEIDSDYFGPH